MTESQLIRHDPCPKCDSSDACAVYDDGHAFCFSCNTHFPESGEPVEALPERKTAAGLLKVCYSAIPKRKISVDVARSNGYGSATWNGQQVQVAEYCNDRGEVVAQKVKTADKRFTILGDAKQMRLWPMHRFNSGGKRLLITEGETDLLAWQSLPSQGNRWPAVSVPNGAPAARKAIAKCLDFVESFEEVILCFDNDDAGRDAVDDVCNLLTPGKVKVMQLPSGCNDICDAVQQGYSKELQDLYWAASPKRPDGIVGSEEILEALLKKPDPGVDYPWKGLTDILHGLRRKELVTLTAGTGVGKSSVAGLIAHSLVKRGVRIGYISLEESLARTAERLVSAELGVPLHLHRRGVTDEMLESTWNDVFDGQVVIFNHFGSMDAEGLTQRVKYMRVAEGVDFVFVDHLSILVSGWGDGDERRLIDNVMTELRSICEQTGVGMVLISHLRSPTQGEKSHEEGGRPKLNQLRGSKAISQLSDAVIAIQRDQQGDDPHTSEVVVLKNRFSGRTGLACKLQYDVDSGLMNEVSDESEEADCPF
ncbi:MAG: topoisomerase [Alteromonadaceae bacterium]|nr:topoisomerase [Alteromonadaceae bacterium]MAA65297.1 topoisomerase [Alteromonadaceae bacterium]|tara:strand:+ start:2408 stop:4015 length:1608 start_codon:yes stop_codon:yes gene_type:complete